MATRGSYVLVVPMTGRKTLRIGKLGTFEFPRGYYLYFGSALAGLEGRVRRHLRREKVSHWHIDYLTAAARVSKVWWAVGDRRQECSWAGAGLEQGDATIPAPGFGSSDCGCVTHLVRLPMDRGALDDARRRILLSNGWHDSCLTERLVQRRYPDLEVPA